MLLGLWSMPGVCSLSVLGSCMSHCWCLFLRMVVRRDNDMEGDGTVLDRGCINEHPQRYAGYQENG